MSRPRRHRPFVCGQLSRHCCAWSCKDLSHHVPQVSLRTKNCCVVAVYATHNRQPPSARVQSRARHHIYVCRSLLTVGRNTSREQEEWYLAVSTINCRPDASYSNTRRMKPHSGRSVKLLLRQVFVCGHCVSACLPACLFTCSRSSSSSDVSCDPRRILTASSLFLLCQTKSAGFPRLAVRPLIGARTKTLNKYF